MEKVGDNFAYEKLSTDLSTAYPQGYPQAAGIAPPHPAFNLSIPLVGRYIAPPQVGYVLRMHCPLCGRPLPPGRPEKRYCSEACRKRAERNRWRARHQDFIRDWKVAHGCHLCGPETVWPGYVLEYHHLDPATKSFELCDYRGDFGRARLQAEVAKCVVLCSNHHRMVEAGDIDLH